MEQGDDTATATEMGDDAEALAIVMAIDRNEINAAEAAQGKELSQPVMDYATMLEQEHTANLNKAQNLSQTLNVTTNETTEVQNLQQKGEDMLAKLNPLNGNEFEREYISSMIQGHQDALNMIDNQLLPSADNDQVRSFLNETRQAVAMHLERAQQLQSNM